jgi:hypothetical protein
MKMYGMIVMFRLHQTNSGALNTMVALKWNGNGEIDILVTILVCWRLGPYADPDQQRDGNGDSFVSNPRTVMDSPQP